MKQARGEPRAFLGEGAEADVGGRIKTRTPRLWPPILLDQRLAIWPLPTCVRRYLCGSRRAIFRKACASSSGSGLAANRKNRLPPRGSILPSTASRSPRPEGCYDPHQPSILGSREPGRWLGL